MSYTKLNEVQVKIDETRQILTEDIDKLTDRGEKLHLLVDKTDRLSESVNKIIFSLFLKFIFILFFFI